LVVWQPLSVWAERFRYEFAATSSEPIRSLGMLDAAGTLGPRIYRLARILVRPIIEMIRAVADVMPRPSLEVRERTGKLMRGVLITVGIGLLLFICYALARGLFALVRAMLEPWPSEARQIPAATAASALRMAIAYLISIGWTLPCAIAASDNPRFARWLAPAAEIIGSLPATALFPLIVVFVIRTTGGMNLASILLILTGMQWYLLFNLLAGVNQIPADLKEAARCFRLGKVSTWRRLTLPALFPSIVTGSITAWGGGWNALILSEYFVYQGHTYKVMGLGALLDIATYETGNSTMILLSLLSMIVVVIGLNRLVWRRMYNVATERYRMDY